MNKEQRNNLAVSLLSKNSRYYKDIDVVEYQGNFMYNKPHKNFYPKSITDKYISLSNDTLDIDKISKKEFKDGKQWWVIAEANNISNPMKLKIGKTIRIPDINK